MTWTTLFAPKPINIFRDTWGHRSFSVSHSIKGKTKNASVRSRAGQPPVTCQSWSDQPPHLSEITGDLSSWQVFCALHGGLPSRTPPMDLFLQLTVGTHTCIHTLAQAVLVLCVLVSPAVYPHSSNIFSWTFQFASFGFPVNSAMHFEIPSVVI